MKHNNYARKERQLKLLAKKLQHLLGFQGEKHRSQIEKLIWKIRNLVSELTHVLSRAKLKRILGSLAIVLGVSVSNQIMAQSFATPQLNPFGLVSTGSFAFPAFADLDGDGDLDLLVGEYYGNMQYFENTGSASNPQFAEAQTNPFGLLSNDLLAFPAFANLDGDGDIDLMVGGYYGTLKYFENTGSVSNPQFAEALSNPFGLVADSTFAFPSFADLDSDGDIDLLAGGYYSSLKYFKNIGSATHPEFYAAKENPFGLTNVGFIAFPAFADLDSDGDLDLLLGEYYGAMKYFENTGSAIEPQFAEAQENPFGLTETGLLSAPAFADLDGDGDIDLLIGLDEGHFHYYENTTITDISTLSPNANLKLFPNPVVDVLRIESAEKIEKIEIIDLLGKTTAMFKNIENSVSLHALDPGIYAVKVMYQNGDYTVRKIQKQ